MNKSGSITKISQALAKAQAEMPVVKMNATNPFLKNKYADLGAVIEASRQTIAKYGLAIIQSPVSDVDKIGLTTLLIHESGEWLEDTIFINAANNKGLSDAQSAGVVISYLRRYSWSAFLGLYADEDSDGHQNPPKQEAKSQESAFDRYTKLFAEAKAIGLEGLEDYQINDKMTANEIIKLGKELRAKVDTKKAGK